METQLQSEPRVCKDGLEALMRCELRALKDNLEALTRSLRSEVNERKEEMAQMEKAWRGAVDEEAMVRRATAIHLETRISDLFAQSNGMRHEGAKPAESSFPNNNHSQGLHESPESLHPTAMTTLPESAEEELLARLDEGFQKESWLQSELQNSIVGRINNLTKRVEEIADCVLAPPERAGEDHSYRERRRSLTQSKNTSLPALRDSSLEVPAHMGEDAAHESRSVRSTTSRRHVTYMGQNSNLRDAGRRRSTGILSEPLATRH